MVLPLWGVMVLGIGLFVLSKPLRQALKSGSMVYSITDQRLFIISGNRRKEVHSYAPESIQRLERTERRDGSGDTVFRHNTAAWNASRFPTKVGFFGVPDIRKVEEMVRRLAGKRIDDD